MAKKKGAKKTGNTTPRTTPTPKATTDTAAAPTPDAADQPSETSSPAAPPNVTLSPKTSFYTEPIKVEAYRPDAEVFDKYLGKGDVEMKEGTPNGVASGEATAAAADTETHEEPVEEMKEPEPDPEQFKEEGNAKYKLKRYGEAAELYTRAIELRPTEPSYLTNRAAAYMALKRFKAALSDCQTAASLQAASPSTKTLNRLARCHLAMGSASACLLTINQILSLDAKDKQALDCQKKAETMQEYLNRFEKAKGLKDWGQAKWALEKATDECEGDQPVQWRVWKVEIDIARRKWDDATIQASDALRLEQNNPDVLAVRGLVCFLTNKMQMALEHLQRALRLDQEHPRARPLLRRAKDVEKKKEEGNAAFKLGRLTPAVELWSETLDAIGQNDDEGGGGHIRAVLLSNRGTAYFKLDRYDDALADISESLELLPASYKALRTKARIRLAKEEYEEAVQEFKAADEQARTAGSDAKAADLKSLADELKKAEVQLKRSKSKDYYKILGIPKSATEIDIKKAYRLMSLKHHPDKGGKEDDFKLVVEANTVLSDPVRRDRYDNGIDEDGSTDSSGGGMGPGMDFEDLLAAFGGGGGGPFGGGGFPGGRHPFGGGGGRGGGHFHSHGF